MFKEPASSFGDLRMLLDFKKTIVYFDKIDDAENAYTALKRMMIEEGISSIGAVGVYDSELLATSNSEDGDAAFDRRNVIRVYHSIKSDEYKTTNMKAFKENRVRILLATEAVGMGCDIPDVVRVIQYGMPKDICTLIQRLGRAVRDPELFGLAILIIQPSSLVDRNVYSNDEDPDLLEYIRTTGCR